MNKKTLFFLGCMLLSCIGFAQAKSKYNLRGIQYSFNRETAAAAPTDYTTIYICLYGGTKSGWNAKTKDYYPVQDKVVWSKMIKLTGLPPARDYRPGNADQLYPALAKFYLNHLIKEYGFTEENNYVTYIADFDFNFVERKLEETMNGIMNNYPKTKFLYTSKFSFEYSDPSYTVSYKGE